jgi:hypothetical protein
MHLRHLDPVLPHLRHQLACVQLTIAPPGLDDLALLLEREVLPLKARPHVLAEEREHLIVADGARVCEVVDARLVVRGEQDGARQQVVQDRVGVGDVDDTGVGCDLGHEGARVQIVRDGHAEAEDEHVGVGGEERLGCGFRGGVEGAGEVGGVAFEVAFSVDRVGIVVGVDTWFDRICEWVSFPCKGGGLVLAEPELTSGSEGGDVDPEDEATVCQIQSADDVAANGGFLVVLAPVDVRSACAAGTVEDVGWTDALEHLHHAFTVFHPDCGLRDSLALAFEELVQMACDPAITTPDKE